jgi:hypothetical protein
VHSTAKWRVGNSLERILARGQNVRASRPSVFGVRSAPQLGHDVIVLRAKDVRSNLSRLREHSARFPAVWHFALARMWRQRRCGAMKRHGSHVALPGFVLAPAGVRA